MTPIRLLFVVVLTVAISSACRPAPEAPPSTSEAAAPAAPGNAPATLNGVVLETMNSGGYTYVKLDTGRQEAWAAVTEFSVRAGERLSLRVEMPIENFRSATLNRTFPVLYFAHLVSGEAPGGAAAPPRMAGSHTPEQKIDPVRPVPGGVTIAALLARRAELTGTSVLVRGRVVKVNNGILGRNWIHVQDGSGNADAGTYDLAVTTDATVRVGEVVTIRGTLATNKDFGAGYAYDAIVEQAVVVGQ